MSTRHVSLLLRVKQPTNLAYVSPRNPHSESKPFMDSSDSDPDPFACALLLPAANVATSLPLAIIELTSVGIRG
jgi:hypothetical protein